MSTTIRERDRDAILQSLRAGVVPRRGQQHIQVGRKDELSVLIQDINRIADGGSGVRFIIGAFGSGKTFFLNLVRSVGMERKLVAIHADLTPDRRLHSTGGHARSLFAELMRNMSTRSKPDGGALPGVVEMFVTSAVNEAKREGVDPSAVIHRRMESLSEMVGGFAFAHVVECYWRGHDTGDDALKASAVRWMRGEFATKTDARQALGVRSIVDDASFYDQLKLLARFVRLAGYGGLLVCLDEMVNLYKMASGRARNTNYEQILRILNDALQGSAEGLGFLFGGTPEFVTDTRRGLYSYAALQSRLAENTFVAGGLVDHSGPVIRLANLTPEDMYVLLLKLRDVHAGGQREKYIVPDEALRMFMQRCSERIGDAYFRTPRNTIREFVQLMAVLEQNPDASWQTLLNGVQVAQESDPALEPLPEDAEDADPGVPTTPRHGDDELTSFTL